MKKTNKKTKLEKTIEKHEKMIEALIDSKTKALVRAKRAEYWIKDQQEGYQEVVRDYNKAKWRMQKAFEIKRLPFFIHVVAHIHMFINGPIEYFTIRPKSKKTMIEVYWGFKKIKKEWEDDFDFTEKKIDEDLNFVKDTEKFIEKQKKLLTIGKRILNKQISARNKKTGARYK